MSTSRPAYDVVVSLDFSQLISVSGSAVSGVRPLGAYLDILGSHCDAIYSFRQFLYMSVLPGHERRWIDDANRLAERLQLPSSVLGACRNERMPLVEHRHVHPWLIAVLARLVRTHRLWDGDHSDAPPDANELWPLFASLDVSEQARLLATPPPLPRSPVNYADAALRKGDGLKDIVVLDLVGYNNQVEWRGRRIGVGVVQRMRASLGASSPHSITSLEQALPGIFAVRCLLQEELHALATQWAQVLGEWQADVVPTSTDGGIGNDGVAASVRAGWGERLAHELISTAAAMGIDGVAVVSKGGRVGDAALMQQAEMCLAAQKLAVVMGSHPAPAVLQCGGCASTAVPIEGPDWYVAKQRATMAKCAAYRQAPERGRQT